MFRFVNFVIVLSVVTCAKVFAAKQSPPHIVFVLADDLVSVFIKKNTVIQLIHIYKSYRL